MPNKYLVIEAQRAFDGDRFPVAKGELRVIRYGYDKPDFIPRVVEKVRALGTIEWGGAVVFADIYRVLFDGVGPLPAAVAARFPRPAL